MGLAVPLTVLNGLDESLALLPSPASAPTASNLKTQFRRARALFDIGDHKKLVLALPTPPPHRASASWLRPCTRGVPE